MKLALVFAIILMSSNICFAQGYSLFKKKAVKPAEETLVNKTIEPEEKQVKKALKVFKNKAKENKYERVEVRKLKSKDNSFSNFVENDQNTDIVFSPDRKYYYYAKIKDDGQVNVFGVEVDSKNEFFISEANNYFVKTCRKTKESYVVLTKNGKLDRYHIFDLDGDEIRFIDNLNDLDNLEKAVCL